MPAKQWASKRRIPRHALTREMLNDWRAIFQALAHPHLPLTNNEAEQALRHWVILRSVCHGTRTEDGTRILAILISVRHAVFANSHLRFISILKVKTSGFSRLALASRFKKLLDKRGTQYVGGL